MTAPPRPAPPGLSSAPRGSSGRPPLLFPPPRTSRNWLCLAGAVLYCLYQGTVTVNQNQWAPAPSPMTGAAPSNVTSRRHGADGEGGPPTRLRQTHRGGGGGRGGPQQRRTDLASWASSASTPATSSTSVLPTHTGTAALHPGDSHALGAAAAAVTYTFPPPPGSDGETVDFFSSSAAGADAGAVETFVRRRVEGDPSWEAECARDGGASYNSRLKTDVGRRRCGSDDDDGALAGDDTDRHQQHRPHHPADCVLLSSSPTSSSRRATGGATTDNTADAGVDDFSWNASNTVTRNINRTLIHADPLRDCPVTSRVEVNVYPSKTSSPSPSSSEREQQEEAWILRTYDSEGRPKTVGGDEFYVVFTVYEKTMPPVTGGGTPEEVRLMGAAAADDPSVWGGKVVCNEGGSPTAVALTTDHRDGTYGLQFVTVPFSSGNMAPFVSRGHDTPTANRTSTTTTRTSTDVDQNGADDGSPSPAAFVRGRLRIYFQTTCSIGALYQPLKDGWRTGGQTNISFAVDDVSIRTTAIRPWHDGTAVPSAPATVGGSHERNGGTMLMNDGNTSPADGDTTAPSSAVALSVPDLRGYDTTLFFGDSLMDQMVMGWYPSTSSEWTFRRHRDDISVHTAGNVELSLSTATVQRHIDRLEERFGEQLRGGGSGGSNSSTNQTAPDGTNGGGGGVALILGSAAWDVIWPTEWQGPCFARHLEAVRRFVTHVRDAYPHVDVYWRLPTAQHIHRAHYNCFDHGTGCIDAVRYATVSRFRYLYHAQKRLMTRKGGLDVTVIDLYDLSYLSAHMTATDDMLHFSTEWNRRVLEMLYGPPP
jgi:hypothetical protein